MGNVLGALGFMLGAGNSDVADTAKGEITDQVTLLMNSYVIPLMMTVATIVLVIFGIINGIRIAKASTDEEKTKAKKNLIGIVLGAFICVASIWLIPLIINIAIGVFPTNNLVGFSGSR